MAIPSLEQNSWPGSEQQLASENKGVGLGDLYSLASQASLI